MVNKDCYEFKYLFEQIEVLVIWIVVLEKELVSLVLVQDLVCMIEVFEIFGKVMQECFDKEDCWFELEVLCEELEGQVGDVGQQCFGWECCWMNLFGLFQMVGVCWVQQDGV